jgi:serine protease Do
MRGADRGVARFARRAAGIAALVGAGLGVGLLLPRAHSDPSGAGAEAGDSSASGVAAGDAPSARLSGAAGDSALFVDPSISRRTAITVAAERVGPAVVTVTVTQVRVVRTGPNLAFHDELFEEFFRQYFPQREYTQRYYSMGSGFIVSRDGYILTNDHVVRGAAELEVTLTDGRKYPAQLVGGDASYDVALLKIDGEELPVAPLGRSEDLIIGEWAIAIGNPFGFLIENSEPTVTAGVVSATKRNIRDSDDGQPGVYREMIQTDAAINPGNSGGPLVNALGDVIGINSFIFSRTGGSVGLGFAIPIDTAKRVMDELIRYGEVRQVWVGVRVQEITPVLAQYLGMPGPTGVIVSFVEPGSPAEEAGMRRGDVIVAINGAPVDDIRQARARLFGAQVGDELALRVLREGEIREVSLTLRQARTG